MRDPQVKPLIEQEVLVYRQQLKLPGLPGEHLRGVHVARGLAYAQYGRTVLELDLFLPGDSVRPLPCIVVIRGGGFKRSDKEAFGPFAAHLAAHGFAAASIAYRGAPEDPFPAAVHDAKAAVRFLRAHADRFGLDPQRFGALGQSAGGHLALMLAVTGGAADLEGPGGHGEQSSRIQAAVSWAGVFDLVARFRGTAAGDPGTEAALRRNTDWVGEPYSETSNRWRAASPFHYVTPGRTEVPPALFVHCRGDSVAPFGQSERMYEALRLVQPATQSFWIDAPAHSIAHAPGVNEQAWAATLSFLTQVPSAPATALTPER